ncbi:S8 family serine peptidase [Heliorestis convoluta]|uniref:Subtilisin-like serine protease n=1 Tax=Heliorestis convoluta TaxID=356322 RepID=A0A5Q2N3M7_9FIRM|nr:S8 family serine peptidase [Heliorestis convoluta]QGG47185.1 Subtilisin-like serine protease [Heliorestis convoluta]
MPKRPTQVLFLVCLFTITLLLTNPLTTAEPTPQLLADRSRDGIGAALVHTPHLIHSQGITGRGETIALADSGLDRGDINNLHPDFQSQPGQKPKILTIQSWSNGPTADTIGHGTHMAGIIAGTGAASAGQYKGMAPDASLYIQAIVDEDEQIKAPDDLSRLYLPAYQAASYIHVNGWGTPGNRYNRGAYQTDRFMANYPDFLVLFGAGNDGPEERTLTGESNSKNALVVGASPGNRGLNDNNMAHDEAQAAALSSRGPTLDGRIKPDLIAPGTGIISTASSMIEPEKHYTIDQGTSMAVATTGGAAALLRQYFRERESIKPSSALLKAALINGARFEGEADPQLHNREERSPLHQGSGFGLLDIGRTLIAFQEKLFTYEDVTIGLQEGKVYPFTVTAHPDLGPLKITLSWTDPADETGTGRLVNDLDLVVLDPEGQAYVGNNHLAIEGPDRRNNVEQVIIPKPRAGEYTIEVRGQKVQPQGQPFALVMGQVPAEEILHTDPATTAPNNEATPPLIVAINDQVKKLQPEDPAYQDLPAGLLTYRGPYQRYAALRIVEEQAIEMGTLSGRAYITPVHPERRHESYPLAAEGKIWINNTIVPTWLPWAKGAKATIWLDQLRQEALQVKASYDTIEGRIQDWSITDRTLQLFEDNKTYLVHPQAWLEWRDEPLGEAHVPGPLLESLETAQVYVGSTLRLILDPESNDVNYIQVQRTMAQGMIQAAQPEQGSLTVEGFGPLKVMDHAPISRNGERANLRDLRPGDYIEAVLLPDTQEAVTITATSKVHWGKIFYLSAQDKIVYYSDQYQRSHQRPIANNAKIQRWDMAVDLSTIPIGGWAWFTLNAEGEVQAIHLVETEATAAQQVRSINRQTQEIITEEDRRYRLFSLTALSRDGLPIPITALQRGEAIEITPLFAPTYEERTYYAAAITAPRNHHRTTEDREAIEINVFASPMGEDFYIWGQTTATELYLYPTASNERISLPIQRGTGQFVWWTRPQREEQGYQLVAHNDQGAVEGRYISLPQRSNNRFYDLQGHWGEEVVLRFVQQGLIKGYGDYTFRPEQTMTLQELAVLFSRTFGWPEPAKESQPKGQARSVAPWAQSAIAFLKNQYPIIAQQEMEKPVQQQDLLHLIDNEMKRAQLEPINWQEKPDYIFGTGGYNPEKSINRITAVMLLDAVLKAIEEEQKKNPKGA